LSAAADLLLHNARVITMDAARPGATMVAIKGNRILKMGSGENISSCQGPGTRVIDCQGKTVLPGFVDAHCHPLALASHLLSVDCGPQAVTSIADIQNRIRQRAGQTPKGDWIRATGYHEFYLAEGRHPQRQDLDQATPDHPIKLTHQSGHACVLNTLALKLLNITAETPEPEGAIIERDLESGEPNGVLFEMNACVDGLMPPLSATDLEKGAELADRQFLSQGITSVRDATWGDAPRRWHSLRRLQEEEGFRPRVSMMIGVDEIDQWEAAGLKSEKETTLRQNGVKVVIHTTRGSLHPPQDQLNRLVLEVHRRGHQLALHAVELETVKAAVTALEHALRKEPRPDHRHRIEHCSVCPPALVQRIRSIGAVVVTQPPFIFYNGNRYLATVAPEEQPWLYPIGSLLASGVRVAGSSDTPVVSASPLVGIYAAVNRLTQTNRPLGRNEAVSVLEALAMYTIEGAFSSFEENVKGSIAEGRLADLVVLSEDPTSVPPERLKELEVVMTILDGRVVWQK
jgi:predicted amidohydrolase YtcJ